jgi:DNA-binding NarL/FixJ family response regulator
MNQIKLAQILIVDDHPLIREGLRARIAAHADMAVCGEAADVSQALTAFKAVKPDLVIVDLALKTGHGLELIKELRACDPLVKILVVSAYDESLYAERALRAGALGYISKEKCRESVIDAIRAVVDGRRYLSPQMTERLVGRAIAGRDPQAVSGVEQFTDRELQVFQLIGQGLTSSAIARQLYLSSHTIDTHREKLKLKLNLKTGAELTQRAVQWILENR